MSGQSDMGTNLLPDPYGFVRIRFQINCLFLEKYVHFIHRQGATDYKAHGQDFRKRFTVTL